MVIPKTTKEIIDIIITNYQYSVKDIAQALDITPKAIYDLQKGKTPSSLTDFNTMLLYIKLKIIDEFKADPNSPYDISKLKEILLRRKKTKRNSLSTHPLKNKAEKLLII